MNLSNEDSLQQVNEKTRQTYNLAAKTYFDLFKNEMEEKKYDRELLDKFAEKFNGNSLICDAGCGPSIHIGKYIFDKGIKVIGIDISDKCVDLARKHNPDIEVLQGDIGDLHFTDNCLDGIISYYSIIDTPKKYINKIFGEFKRVLKPGGSLLVVVKAGNTEGYLKELLGIESEIYFTLFNEDEIKSYFSASGFVLEFLEKRNPYDFEIDNERIYAIGIKSEK